MSHNSYDEMQQRAVDHLSGPLLCVAGPGSGKTTVITGRTAALLAKGVPPENILVITFTNAAAREMEQRFMRLCPGAGRGITFSTFHSLFFRILKAAYGYTADNIISSEQKSLFFKSLMDKMRLDVEDEKDYMQRLQSEISRAKAEGTDPEKYFPMEISHEIFVKVYRAYEDMMIKEGLIDFDDMQLLCYELLTKREDILKRWQEKYKYILVDEAQDTNLLQYRLICMLAAPQNNLMMVGDDDQSIYRFRGARSEILLGFEKRFPDAKKVFLSTNYRCGKNIVAASGKLIEDNKNRFDKSLRACDTNADGVITLKCYDDQRAESLEILKRIIDEHKQGRRYEDMAVLFRTNLSGRNIVDELMRSGIPINLIDSIPDLYEHWIFRDIKAYIRLAMGERDRQTVMAVINRPKRYVGRDALIKDPVSFLNLRMYYSDKSYVTERIEKLSADLNMIKNMRPYSAVHYIRHGVGYDDYVKEYASDRGMKADDLFEVLNEIEEDASKYKDFLSWFIAAEKISEGLKEKAEENRRRREKTEGVSVMTYHSAKGLEFSTCFLPGVNDGVVPYKKATGPAEIEEERRMLYVAMTRAASELNISYTKKRYGKEAAPSPFLVKVFDKKT